MSKYEPLRRHLEGRSARLVPMTFAEIEKVLGFKLPESQKYAAWWSNNPNNNVMTNEWLAAGYKSEQVDIEGRKVVFRRVRSADPMTANTPQSAEELSKQPRRHRLFGWMKNTITIMPETDLTSPADPSWADIAWGKDGKVAENNEKN